MSIIRVNKSKENPYLIMNKTGLNDINMTLKAKGLLTYFLSLPDDWQIYEDELIKHHKDGKDSIKSAIKELVSNGYMTRVRQRDKNGMWRGYEYTIYETPNHNGLSNNGLTNVGKSASTNKELKPSIKELSTKNILHVLSESEYESDTSKTFLKYYKQAIINNKGKEHCKVSENNQARIQANLKQLEDEGITAERWIDEVDIHFRDLKANNNGSIIPFLKASMRYFDINLD